MSLGLPMPAQLLSLNEGPNILLDKPILLLGRHPECDVQIESRKISRRHCCIAQVSDYLVVRDLGSTNGLRINGVRVLEGRLAPGDELTIGTYRYRVVWDSLAGGRGGVPAAVGSSKSSHSLRLDEDDILEECDDPVALPEPKKPVADIPLALVKPPPNPPPANKATMPREESLILPDHLDLLPPSDICRRSSQSPPA
jgi:predicted component of type VI protein secretion system